MQLTIFYMVAERIRLGVLAYVLIFGLLLLVGHYRIAPPAVTGGEPGGLGICYRGGGDSLLQTGVAAGGTAFSAYGERRIPRTFAAPRARAVDPRPKR